MPTYGRPARAAAIMACTLSLCIMAMALSFMAAPTALPGASLAHAQQESDSVAVITTDMGTITIEFFPEDAPNHVSNFIGLAESGFYDGTLFHRIIPDFMIQGGDPNTISGPEHTWGTGGPAGSVAAEFNNIMHDRGIVSMARSQHPDSAGSQFFIVHQNSNFLDGQYTAFGRIITEESFDTLDAIAGVQTGEQNRPADPEQVRIKSITVTERSEVFDALDLQPPARAGAPPFSFDTQAPRLYNNEEIGVSFMAPEGWLLQEPRLTNPAAPDVVMIGAPQDVGIPQIYIYANDAPEGQESLEDVASARTAEIQGILSAENLATVEQEITTLSGIDAHLMTLVETVKHNDTEVDVRFVEILTYHDGRVYSVAYANVPQHFEGVYPHFEGVLETFVLAGTAKAGEAAEEQELLQQQQQQQQEEEEQQQQDTTEDVTTIPADTVDDAQDDGGGCLIATAAFGTEMAPQVQSLRELRDGTIMSTQSGAAFMSGFNTVYYSFSPHIADAERAHPVVRDVVRIIITPLISSLSIMSMAEADSEYDVIAYGMAVILLNAGLYVAAPVLAAITIVRIAARRHRHTPRVVCRDHSQF